MGARNSHSTGMQGRGSFNHKWHIWYADINSTEYPTTTLWQLKLLSEVESEMLRYRLWGERNGERRISNAFVVIITFSRGKIKVSRQCISSGSRLFFCLRLSGLHSQQITYVAHIRPRLGYHNMAQVFAPEPRELMVWHNAGICSCLHGLNIFIMYCLFVLWGRQEGGRCVRPSSSSSRLWQSLCWGNTRDEVYCTINSLFRVSPVWSRHTFHLVLGWHNVAPFTCFCRDSSVCFDSPSISI